MSSTGNVFTALGKLDKELVYVLCATMSALAVLYVLFVFVSGFIFGTVAFFIFITVAPTSVLLMNWAFLWLTKRFNL